MKKEYGLIVGIIVVFLLLHAGSLQKRRRTARAETAYSQGAFAKQIELYQGMERTTPILFSEGTARYHQNIADAYAMRSGLQTSCAGDLCGDIQYNLGNAAFYLGSGTVAVQEKMQLRQQAILHYEHALRVREDVETAHNKAVVEKLLEALEEDQNGEQSDSAEDSQQSGDSEDTQPNGTSNDQQAPSEGGDQPSLSEGQRQELQDYQEQLEQQQRSAQQYFNKVPQQGQPQGPQDIFDMFFGAPDQREETNGGGEEKDW